jgi:hypothetical protein
MGIRVYDKQCGLAYWFFFVKIPTTCLSILLSLFRLPSVLLIGFLFSVIGML